MALSHFAYVRRNVISSGVAVAMAATMAFPAVALADSTNGSEEDSAASRSASLESGVSVDETDANSAGESQTNYVAETTGVQVNKEDYYSEEGSPEALISLFSMGRSASGLRPVNLSSDVTYFGAYEGGSYAQTLSSGDGSMRLAIISSTIATVCLISSARCMHTTHRNTRCLSSSIILLIRPSRPIMPCVKTANSRRSALP